MKLSLTLLLLISCCNTCFSQNLKQIKKDSSVISELKKINIPTDSIKLNPGTNTVPFSKITFTDLRADTSCIGIFWKLKAAFFIKIENLKIDTKNGLSGGFDSLFNNRYAKNFSAGNTELVCFVKKFFVAGKDTITDDLQLNEINIQANAEIECFYKTDGMYYPATRLDTVIYKSVPGKIGSVTIFLNEIVQSLANKISRLDSGKLIKRKAYTEDSITGRYAQLTGIPILNTGNPKKGVYLNFKEFKSNNPSVTDYNIEKSKQGTFFISDKENNAINTIKAFGFCDGSNAWIFIGNYIFPLIKNGNSFGFLFRPWGFNSVYLCFALQMENNEWHY